MIPELVPVLNVFNGSMRVKIEEAVRLVQIGKCRMVGPRGNEVGIEWVFRGSAVSPSAPTSRCGHNARLDVSAFCGGDAFPGMPVLQPGPFTGNYTV